ncbi:MAG: M20 family metallopeptidase [Arachnia sp.]
MNSALPSDATHPLVTLRRDLHQIPEAGLHLPLTQARLLRELEGLPLEITTGQQLSSIVAVLRGGRPSVGEPRVVLLRGDMDGLPVQELTGIDFASTNGNMHACGHDLHMALLVGAVRSLCEAREELAGDVVFMFQPGEEGHDGAGQMIAEGLLQAAGARPTAAYAIHVWSSLEPLGRFNARPGTMMAAADVARVRVIGQGGHGSTPHRAVDPVPATAEMVTALNTMVTRRFDVFDPVVVTVGRLSAGTAPNVIPESAEFDATLRSFSAQSRDQIMAQVPQLLNGIAAAHGVRVEIEFTDSYPATVNHAHHVGLVAQAVSDLFGEDRYQEWERPLVGSEDFSRVLLEVPGCFIGLSACPADLDPGTAPFNHSAYARFDDAVLADGAALLTELARRHLR